MPKKRLPRSKPPSSLRQGAEEALRVNRTEITRMSPEEIQRLVHELQVHQIELEMQNEELRHAQSELSQSRDRFNDLYDFAPVGYLTLDHEGNVIEANLTVAGMLGIERAKLVGRRFIRFVARTAQDALYLHQHALLEGSPKQACELLLRRADGTQFFARMETIALADSTTGARHCRSAIIDITERQETEAALRASEERYRTLHETMRDAFVSVDMRGRILEYNAAYQEMLGYSDDELRARTYVQLTPKKWRATEAAIVAEQVLPRGYSGVYEKEYRRKDGTIFPVELRTFLIRGADDQPIAMWAIVRDITVRREAAKLQARFHAELEQEVVERTAALRQSERTARAVVDGLSAHVALVDDRGHILAVNQRWQEFAHENDGALISVGEGANYLKVCAASARRKSPGAAAVAAGIRDVLAGRRRDFSAEYPCHSPRAQRWFIVRVTPFPGDGPPRVVVAHENITPRMVAEQALRESEERYRQLIHALPVALYTCDLKGRVLLHNAAAVKLWGREPDLRRDRWGGAHRLFTAEGKRIPRTQRPMAQAVQQGEPIRDVELIIERPDGSRSHVLAFPDPLRDSSGAVTGAVNVLVEITALKAAENALRASERNLRTFSRAIEQSPASILITTPSGEIDYVNPKFTEVTGYSFAEVIGKSPRLLKSGEHPAEFYRRMWATITSRRDWRGELCNRRKNGELFWEFAVIAAIHDEHGAITHFVAIKEDITERRRAAAALRDSAERLRAILNTVADAVITIDRRGTITSVNPACARIFGYPEGEMIGQNVRLLMPSPYREEHDGYLENYHRTGQARIIGIGREVRAQRKDGTEFPVELAVSEVEHLDMFTGVLRDLSRRKQLEAEVLRIGEEERRRISADLHDGICQEMVGIQYLAILLLRDLEKARHPLAAQARRIEEAIIKTTLQSRELARGLSPVVADGSGLMHALRQLAQTTSAARRIRCSFECPEPVTIENPTTANELYRIAQEAILNAVRHAHAKRITVRLTQTNGAACLAVTDNGPGLPADVESAPGMGLRVMRYRASVIGGQLLIRPRRRGGTEVICRWEKEGSKA